MQSFHLNLLKEELNLAGKGRNVFNEKFETNNNKFREKLRPEMMTSVIVSIRRGIGNHSDLVEDRLNIVKY